MAILYYYILSLMKTRNNFFAKLLKSSTRPLSGFEFDIEQIIDLYEWFIQEYDKITSNQYDEEYLKFQSYDGILSTLSTLTKNIPLSDVNMRNVRWFDVNSSAYNTDNLASSFIPSLPISNPTKSMVLCQAPLYESMNIFLENQIKRDIKTFVVLETVPDLHIGDQIAYFKYYPYWSNKLLGEKKFGNFIIKTINIENYTNIDMIHILITNDLTGFAYFSKIIHYLAWPDRDVISIDELHNLILFITTHTSNEDKLLLHCSAGIGRAGTLCSSLILNSLTREELDSVKITELVLLMKVLRPRTIQTPLQYQLLCEYAEFLKKLT
jgi:protein tyrosine phosphatase